MRPGGMGQQTRYTKLGRVVRLGAVLAFALFTLAIHKGSCGSTESDQVPVPFSQINHWFRDHPDIDRLKVYKNFPQPKDPNQYIPSVFVRDVANPYYNGSVRALAQSSSLDRTFKGSFSLGPLKGPKAAQVRRFASGTITRGYSKVTLLSIRTENIRVNTTAVLKFKGAGTACVALNLKAVSAWQLSAGTFKFLGGTGAAARLYGGGPFAAAQPKPESYGFVTQLGFNPRFGKPRTMPARCGMPPKAKTAPAKTVTATVAGFAVSNAPPSKSAKLTPPNGTITSCSAGGSLYMVLDYTGPTGTEMSGAAFGGSTTGSFTQKLKPGRNVVRLIRGAKSASYEIKVQISSTTGRPLKGTTVLLPTVTVSC